jgi:hypothetical protein
MRDRFESPKSITTGDTGSTRRVGLRLGDRPRRARRLERVQIRISKNITRGAKQRLDEEGGNGNRIVVEQIFSLFPVCSVVSRPLDRARASADDAKSAMIAPAVLREHDHVGDL